MGGGLPNGVFPALALLFPATEESLRTGVATLFGEAEARAAAHYRLMNDIDATQTRQTNWHEGQGFLPVGDSASPFLGALDGTGYAIRGLQMRRAGEMAGFFGVVGAGGRILNLGVDGGEVEGDSMVGLLAARVEAGGVIEGAWGRGRVRGSDNVGGLAGYLADGATMRRSWFGGHVRGRRNVGGLVGGTEARSRSADTIANSWAMAQTYGFVGVGGLAGSWESGNRMTASWAGGPFIGLGSGYGLASGSGESSASYSGVETSGRAAAGVGGTAVDSLQTLVASEWSGAVWDFGSDSDFPALRDIETRDDRSRSLQAGGIIFGLTRLLRGDGAVFPALPLDMTTSVSGDEQSVLRLDVNGLAADDGSATAGLSSCRISSGAISAASNYNGARVSMFLLSSFGARLSLYDGDFCATGIDSGAGGLATLRLSYAGAGSESEDVLHLDYAAQLSPSLIPPLPFGFADAPTDFYAVAADASLNAAVLTVRVNGWRASFLNHHADIFSFAGGSDTALIRLAGGSSSELFDENNREYVLTLLARDGLGLEKELQLSLRSSPRAFAGELLSLSLAAGVSGEVLSPSRASLTIWHNDDEEEEYVLLGGNDVGITVDERSGGLYARGIFVRGGEYEMTLELRGGGVTARRDIKAVYEEYEGLQPVFAGVLGTDLDEAITVFSGATAGESVLTVTVLNGSLVSFADVNGFASAGGAAAALSLSSDATVLFDMDGLALSLTLTLAGESGEETTGTVTFVSSAREFNGTGLSTLIVTTALAAGTEVFGSSAAGLTIWHSPNEDEAYALEGESAGLFVVGLDGAVSARDEIRPTELVRYELTLALSDGEVTARRGLTVELTPPLLDVSEDLSELSGLRVTVEARATVGDFVWGVMPPGGMFAPFADVNGFASAGGAAAALSLSSDATALFDMDGLALSLTLTLTAESGEETTGTVTFVSSAREFNGLGLTTLIVTAALAAGTEVFGSSDAGLTIWHSPNESESYTLEGANANLFGASAAGAVRVSGEIRPTELTRYELTLALSDGGVTARRGLTVELTPLLLDVSEDLSELSGLRVTVEARATAGDFVWGVAPAGGMFASFADVNGFASAGGAAAALSLATDATALFDMDGLALSLTLTLTAESGEETTGTVTFVSSAREFNGTGLSTRIVTAALAAGTEVFGSSDASLTIWHSPNEDETYTLEGADAGLFVVGTDGAVSARDEIRPTELTRYELTLALSDGAVTARRGLTVELTPPLLDVSEDLSELSGLRVTVAARATAGDFVWGVTPAAGGMFAPFADVNGFASAGGSAAALSLATDATALFDMDGLALSLTLTLTAESGEETTGTVTFVSSALEFNGTGLSTLIVTAALAAGTEVFAAADAGLTIWHSPNENETYTLEGANANLFTVGAAGAVSVTGEIRPTELTRYELTLALSDGGVTARRALAVELTPPLLEADEDLTQLRGLTVTVEARATVGDFVWGVTPAAGGMFAPFADVNGFASAGGSAAALSLATDATALFDMDELALSLTLTLTAETGEETTGTVTFVSSALEFNGTGLSTLIVTAALAAGTQVFAAAESGLTIWHSPNENETYTLEGANANLFTVGAAGAVSVTGEIRPTELTRYELTLALSDGGVTARRALAVELTPPLLEADEDLTQLRGLTVTVEARRTAGDFVWGVTPAAGGMFAPFADVNGFASAGGSAAALSLATDATALFDMDGLALSLTLTLTAETGEETTGTVTFVSSALEFNGTGLSTRIVTAALAAGTEVFAATDAGLTIWHSPNENETYTLEGANANLFTVGAAGAVSVSRRDSADGVDSLRIDAGVVGRRGDGAAGVGGGIDAAVAGGGRGFDAVARLAGDGGSEGDGERLCVGRDAGGGRDVRAVRGCERIRERGRIGGGVVVGDGRDGAV